MGSYKLIGNVQSLVGQTGNPTGGSYPSTHIEYVTRILDDLSLIGTTGAMIRSVSSHRLDQNSPSPFNPTTNVQYFVASDNAWVHLAVYDVRGRLVTALVDDGSDAREHAVTWNGTDAWGRKISSGICFLRAAIGGWESAHEDGAPQVEAPFLRHFAGAASRNRSDRVHGDPSSWL